MKRFRDREEEERFPFRKGIIVIMWAQYKLQGGGKENRETQKSCETGASERQKIAEMQKLQKLLLIYDSKGREGKGKTGGA